jgi:hypothetical protein
LLAGVVAVGGGWLGGGCGAGFDSISQVTTLRVLAATPERPQKCGSDDDCAGATAGASCVKEGDELVGICQGCDEDAQCRHGRCLTGVCLEGGSYADPGDEVLLSLTAEDALLEDDRPLQIRWLAGCFNPPGDQYFNCYEPLAELFGNLDPAAIAAGDLPDEIGITAEFSLKIPEDILTSRPVPVTGPHYGIGYVFFAVCAGELRIVPPEGTSTAGSFPLGCFDIDSGKRLGADSFVPGYTQIYVFADGRDNQNPRITGLTLDEVEIAPETAAESTTAKVCPVTEEERRVGGCAQTDVKSECTLYDISVTVPADVAEVDPDANGPDGEQLREAVWVDYYIDGGDLDSSVKLLSDATSGYNDDHAVEWIPPSTPGRYNVWAVVHDARGGSTMVTRAINVQ